jgi:hypothetical protein
VPPFERLEGPGTPDRLVCLCVELACSCEFARLHLQHLPVKAQQREKERHESSAEHEHADRDPHDIG